MENVNHIKAAVSGVIALLTALWGWFGWLVLLWIVCLGLDYITGTCAALKDGRWSSKLAREGCWHKVGSIMAVLVSAILDLAVGQIMGSIPGIELPFTYTVFLCPLVVVWYILTEAGSITENAGKLGAPIPPWLKKAIAAFKSKLDEDMDKKTPETHNVPNDSGEGK